MTTLDSLAKRLARIESKIDARPTGKDIAAAVWGHPLYGFSAHWHLRMGLITDPSHRNFPADPDSPMFYMLREWAAANDGRVAVYTAEGVVQMAFNPDTEIFEMVEDGDKED